MSQASHGLRVASVGAGMGVKPPVGRGKSGFRSGRYDVLILAVAGIAIALGTLLVVSLPSDCCVSKRRNMILRGIRPLLLPPRRH